WYALALAAFALALFSKEQSVVVPALFALADALGLSGDAPGRDLLQWARRYSPIAGILALYFGIRHFLFGGAEYAFGSATGPLAPIAYALETIVAPFAELRYEPTRAIWFSAPRMAVAAAVAAALTLAAIRTRTAAEPATRFWLGWFVLTLLPTANL